jgi:hypothetical protein
VDLALISELSWDPFWLMTAWFEAEPRLPSLLIHGCYVFQLGVDPQESLLYHRVLERGSLLKTI